MISDIIFNRSVAKVKKNFIELLKEADFDEPVKKCIVMNMGQLWPLKLFNIFLIIAKYFQKNGYLVKILTDDGVLKHMDMVKKNESIDISILKMRSKYVYEELVKLDPELFISYSAYTGNLNFKDMKYQEFAFNNIESPLLYASMIRYDNNLDDEEYRKLSLNNMYISKILAENVENKYNPIAILNISHNEKYSLGTFYHHFETKDIKCLTISLPLGGSYKKNGALNLFSKSDEKFMLNFLFNKLFLDKEQVEDTNVFMKKRVVYDKTPNTLGVQRILQEKKEEGRKIVAVFPNVFEDVAWTIYHSIFDCIKDWFIETINYLKDNNYFIVIKAHPGEKKWGVKKSSIEYIANEIDSNFLILENDSDVSAYSLFPYLDLCVVYNGTLLLESMYSKIPMIAGGNSYIIKGLFNQSVKNKDDYFSLFDNIDILFKNQNQKRKELIKYIYFEIFCREIKVKFLNNQLEYPSIDNAYVKEMFINSDLSLDLLVDIVAKDKSFNLQEYKELFKF